MYWDVVEVKPEKNLKLWVRFKDGMTGHVHFSPSFFTGVFVPLKNKDFFNRVYLEEGAVAWPGEIDLAPDAMYHEIKKAGEWRLTA